MTISLKDIQEIMNNPSIDTIVNKITSLEKTQNDLCVSNRACVTNYNKSIGYLIKEPISLPFLTVPLVDDNGKKIIDVRSVVLNKEGITQKSSIFKWLTDSPFDQFIKLEANKKEEMARVGYSLMEVFLTESIHEPLVKVLSDEGVDIFNKLATKYYQLKPTPLSLLKGSYPIHNITKEEREYFNIKTNDASLYIKNYVNRIMIFLSNRYFIKDAEFPTFKYRVFSNEQDERMDYIPEKIFIANHQDEILNGVNNYLKMVTPKIDTHLEFLNYANSLVEKYAVLSKI